MDRHCVAAQRAIVAEEEARGYITSLRKTALFFCRVSRLIRSNPTPTEAKVMVTRCGHVFHQACFDTSQRAALLSRGERSCPVCRGLLPDTRPNSSCGPFACLHQHTVQVKEFVEVLWYAEWCTNATRAYFVAMVLLVSIVFVAHVGPAVEEILRGEEHEARETMLGAESAWNAGGWWDARAYTTAKR